MNTTNANQTLGFDKLSECDYNLHWSFSNFNRNLMVAGHVARLPKNAKVLELGAGSSDIENIVKKNFRRNDICFYKIDGDSQYETDDDIVVMDITSKMCDAYCKANGSFDAVIFTEVIEHLDNPKAIIRSIYDWLIPEGIMLFTTPTPPYDGAYEDRVWPTDHDHEFTHEEVYCAICKYFKINKEIGWSLEEREYNELQESDANFSMMCAKLRGAFPESYVRAIAACLAPVKANRQIFFLCKKRRLPAYG